ncbi:hypothetical protein RHGRI_020103 [Rhododendron griersonianum]|uniref:DNA helicase Pif1-like 2B domain-containing protein n=1 Tax=Rhododendron griersonianum TaxID=479676 RepID=A0AAV6JIH9_9ERIC|nr:hypothetical protein RHGRI_020103 [Rhododendron griersonianum]
MPTSLTQLSFGSQKKNQVPSSSSQSFHNYYDGYEVAEEEGDRVEFSDKDEVGDEEEIGSAEDCLSVPTVEQQFDLDRGATNEQLLPPWGGGASSPRASSSLSFLPFLVHFVCASPLISALHHHRSVAGIHIWGIPDLCLTARGSGGWQDARPITAGNHFWGSLVLCLTARCLSSCVPTIRDPVDLRFGRGFAGLADLDLFGGGGGVCADKLCPIEHESDDQDMYPPELLHSLNLSGLPNHCLKLKVGTPIILLRNVNLSLGLCNGTHLIVVKMRNQVIEAKVVTSSKAGEIVRLHGAVPSSTHSLFTMKGRQFPIKFAFSMTINKSQEQTLKNVGLYLPNSCFCHGQLYVALSRVISPRGLKILIVSKPDMPDDVTQNIPQFREVKEVGERPSTRFGDVIPWTLFVLKATGLVPVQLSQFVYNVSACQGKALHCFAERTPTLKALPSVFAFPYVHTNRSLVMPFSRSAG